MHFNTVCAAALALATSAYAQIAGFDVISAPTEGEEVPAGKTFTIKWAPETYKSNTVSIALLGGASATTLLDLGSNGVIASK
jgi:hypothetical protein